MVYITGYILEAFVLHNSTCTCIYEFLYSLTATYVYIFIYDYWQCLPCLYDSDSGFVLLIGIVHLFIPDSQSTAVTVPMILELTQFHIVSQDYIQLYLQNYQVNDSFARFLPLYNID